MSEVRDSQPGNPPPETSALTDDLVSTGSSIYDMARLTVRPRTSDQVESNLLGCSEEWLIGENSFGGKVAWASFEWCPINVLYDC
jgi:hypothetical protein